MKKHKAGRRERVDGAGVVKEGLSRDLNERRESS